MTSFSVQQFRARFDDAADVPFRANAPLAIALGGAACLCGFVLVGPLVSRGIADDAGVMSFLLGEGARRSPPAVSSFRFMPRPRAEVAAYRAPQRIARVVVRAKAVLAARLSKPITHKAPVIVAITPPPPRRVLAANPISLSPLTDSTLRRGDAVMTTAGIRVFQGARRYPFAVRDFSPLAFAGNVPHRGALLAIDHVVSRPGWSVSFHTGLAGRCDLAVVPGDGNDGSCGRNAPTFLKRRRFRVDRWTTAAGRQSVRKRRATSL